MAKPKPQFTIKSFGIYDGWEKTGKSLAKIQQTTTSIPAQVDIEFGLILHAQKAKGLTLTWCIEHPDIPNEKGQPMSPFMGKEQVRTNNWDFYLGDTIWLPEHDKVGPWRMYIQHQDLIIAEKTFHVTTDCLEAQAESRFWKRRGF